MSNTQRTDLVECSHCGLVQRAGASAPGNVLHCARCESRLPGGPVPAHALAIACACAAALLLMLALGEPVFQMHLLGRFASAGVLTGPHMLAKLGMPELAVVVLLTLLVAPVGHLLILGLALLGNRLPNPHRFMFLPLGLVEHARRWSMPDVFLLATLVCYMRLHAWANVQVGSAIIALLALTFVTFATELTLDPESLWTRMPWHRTTPRESASTLARQRIACEWCGLLNEAHEGERCARCARTLHARKPRSLLRAGTLLMAATLLCVPANVLPVMDMIQFGRNDSNTIYSGVVELTQHQLWGLAVVIFVASIVIPLIKIVALALLLWTTAHKQKTHLLARTRAFRFIRAIGRWSMVDVFAVTVLVSLVHMGILATVLPRYGAVAFCAVVVLTILAVEAFDPRLMWDAAGHNDVKKPEQAS